MLINIIIFFIVLVSLTIFLKYSRSFKEDFFTIPDPDYHQMIKDSIQKVNPLSTMINLTNPQLPLNSETSNTLEESTSHISATPSSRNFELDLKKNYDVPEDIPQGLQLAKSCQEAPKSCSAFDNSEFEMNCGMSFDKNGMNSEGNPHMGGLFVSFFDRKKQTLNAENVLAKNESPYDPYKVYQPTLGNAKPGTFALTKDQCVIVKEKVDCTEKQSFNSPNCTQCLTSGDFSRLDPDTPRIPFRLFLVGMGTVAILTNYNELILDENNLNEKTPIEVTIPSDYEGRNIIIYVGIHSPKKSKKYVSGYIEGQTGRGPFKLDLNYIIDKDLQTNTKPRLNGTSRINGFRALSQVPGNKQEYMILSCIIPFSFISMYEYDAIYCDNGPFITKEASAVFLESNPCFNKKNKPGNYTLECLQSRWIAMGGTSEGTGYPSTQQKADAIQKDSNGNPLNIDDIMDQLSEKMNKAITGVDSNGVDLSISEWNDLSMWGLGIPIESPCDGINKDSGPLSQRCLTYLYRNKGSTSRTGPTYTMPSKVSSMKEGFIDENWVNMESKANVYNYPGTSLDPKKQSGLDKVADIGGVNAVKQTYDSINRVANDNTLSNTERASEISQAYGVKLDPPSSNEVKGKEQVFAVGPGYDYRRDEAEAICMKYGAKLANTQQLKEAQKNGADWCFSGWVSDGGGKWPITTSVVGGCGGRRGVIEWTPDNQKAGVNCYGPKPLPNQYPAGTIKPFNGDLWDQPNKPTYVTVKSGYLETSGPQPSCFSGLSPEQAQKNCDALGQQCAGFSYSKDGTGNGCYKGNLDAGINPNPNYMGYVKIPPSSMSMIQGRYIRLQYPHQQCLNLAQIFVYSRDGGPNIITPSTPVSKSSDHSSGMYPSQNFVNQRGADYYNFVHTSCYDVPWIEVDLGSVVPIYKIVIWNRKDCCQERILGAVLSILNNDKEMVYISNPINSTNASYTWLPPNGEVFLDRDTMPPPADRKVYGNNGTTSCDNYCRGANGGPWNNELPRDWNGAKCVGHSPNIANCFSGFSYSPGSYCLCRKTGTGWDSRGWRPP